MSLYLLNIWMDLIDTFCLHVVRYLSEVLCCTIMTHLSDFEVKVTEILCCSFLVKVFLSLFLMNTLFDLDNTMPPVSYSLKFCTVPSRPTYIILRSRSWTSKFYCKDFGQSLEHVDGSS